MSVMMIPGHSDYFAGEDGFVYSRRRGPLVRLKGIGVKRGYHYVVIRDDEGAKQTRLTHRLVALAFHGHPPEPTMQCMHLDGNSLNNKPENLAWGTREQNAADRKASGGYDFKLNQQIADDIRREVSEGKTQAQVCRERNISSAQASRIVNRIRWK